MYCLKESVGKLVMGNVFSVWRDFWILGCQEINVEINSSVDPNLTVKDLIFIEHEHVKKFVYAAIG